ncbi:MAG: hypothetical protein CMM52_13550 [Rhodospirillaceae bacterium]|nr:hypothetical protein [Rhodospirillaceae bacterium]|tara:strand:+ start:4236 stop:4418 length:183 start_codon:yes stop_codon:yes gene_type:complete
MHCFLCGKKARQPKGKLMTECTTVEKIACRIAAEMGNAFRHRERVKGASQYFRNITQDYL